MFNPELMKHEDWLYTKTNQDRRRYEYGSHPYHTGPISNNPTFFDVGAYNGEWSQIMTEKYGGTSHIFEIQPAAIKNLKKKFKSSPNIFVNPFGLASSEYTSTVPYTGSNDCFSLFPAFNHGKTTKVKFKNIKSFIEINNITSIDVIKINIEGGEYDLLEYMIQENLHTLCKNLQIQFHAQYPIPNFFQRYRNITNTLQQSHQKTLDFFFVWENWKLS